MEVRKNREQMNALLPHRRFGRGVGVVNAVEEGREGFVPQASSNGLELVNGDRKGVAVGEFVEASDDPQLEIVGRPGGWSELRRTQGEALGGND